MQDAKNERIKRKKETVTVPDKRAQKAARERLNQLTKPRGSLGRLEDLAVKLAGIRGDKRPKFDHKTIAVFAADHGVARENVSAYPQQVTGQMLMNFAREGAAINVLANVVKAEIKIVDMGTINSVENPKIKKKRIGNGTKNIAREPAMTREEAMDTLIAGIEIAEELIVGGTDLLCLGDMGIGNTTPSSAIVASILDCSPREVTGRGTGLNPKEVERKAQTVKSALKLNKPDAKDPIDVLSKVGGYEIGGLTGCILGATAEKVPVLLDGFITTAAALLAVELEPKVKNFLIASHLSQEPGHKIVLDYLGQEPLLDLDLRLGEGTGAALAIPLVDASTRILNEMATFSQMGISQNN